MTEKIQIEKMEKEVIKTFSRYTTFSYDAIMDVYLASGKSFDRTLAGLKIAQKFCVPLDSIVECLR